MIIIILTERFLYKNYNIDTARITDKGGRPVNEDFDGIFENDKKDALLCAVADGLGAHGGGDIASRTAVYTASEEFKKIKKLNDKNILRVYNSINEAVLRKHTNNVFMKTTFAGIFIRKNNIVISHIGDTRIYLLKNNEIRKITADHSVSYEEVMKNGGGYNDIRGHPKRHILTAALGVSRAKKPCIQAYKIKNIQFGLICSDGFWEYVREEDIKSCCRESGSCKEWLEKMLEIHQSSIGEYNDNYSALCLKIENKETQS